MRARRGAWRPEVANALLIAVRRKRISPEDAHQFLVDLEFLPIRVDTTTKNLVRAGVFPMAEQCGITAYDAAYPELAICPALTSQIAMSKIASPLVVLTVERRGWACPPLMVVSSIERRGWACPPLMVVSSIERRGWACPPLRVVSSIERRGWACPPLRVVSTIERRGWACPPLRVVSTIERRGWACPPLRVVSSIGLFCGPLARWVGQALPLQPPLRRARKRGGRRGPCSGTPRIRGRGRNRRRCRRRLAGRRFYL